ncbi:hypothetical protein EV426DRAFT_613007 [Tirmania nivea]|nr:hypothetical protein EV426DRAFT_613007 [Tirmania nivea]
MAASPNDNYFLSSEPSDWNYTDFSKVFIPHDTNHHSCMYYYKACLSAISHKKVPFTSTTEDGVRTAKRLLSLLKDSKSKSNKKRQVYSNKPTAISVENVTIGDLVGENAVGFCIDSGTFKRRKIKDSGSSVKTSLNLNTKDVEDEHSPFSQLTEEPGVQLPSGPFLEDMLKTVIENQAHGSDDEIAFLKKGVFFPHQAGNFISNAEDLDYVQSLFPPFHPTSSKFNELLDAHKDFISQDDPGTLPTCPFDLSEHERNEWFYIHAAVIHFRQHFTKIASMSSSHGEGWSDVNIWAHLLDTAFLYSDTLSLDRKEIQSNVHGTVTATQKTPSYDGILRSSQVTRKERIDIGFIEVKPARSPYPKDSTSDRLKVINAMQSSLLHLKRMGGKPDMKKVVVVGVICNGTSMTVLQAWNLSSQLLFFKENEFVLTLENLPLLIQTCWRLKLASESTFQTISSIPISRFNQPL